MTEFYCILCPSAFLLAAPATHEEQGPHYRNIKEYLVAFRS